MSTISSDLEAEVTNRVYAEAEKQRNLFIDDAVKALLSTANGRAFLWWLLEIGKWNSQPFALDTSAMAFGCGEMNVGKRVMDRLIGVDPEGFVKLMVERADAGRELDQRIRDRLAEQTARYPDHSASDDYLYSRTPTNDV